MPISLVKGQKADITKTNPGISQFGIGLSWQAPAHLELDTSAFLLAAGGRVANDDHLVFYNNPSKHGVTFTNHPSHGADKKQFILTLSQVPAQIERIAFTLTIYDGEKLKQAFNQVTQAYLRIFHPQTGEDIVRYDLGNHFSVETAIVVGELYRYGSDWKFSAVGAGFAGGLKALCGNYGIEVTDDAPAQSPGIPHRTSPPQAPIPPSPAHPIRLGKIELKKKGDLINLEKKAPGTLGEIVINLNWNQQKSSGLFGRRSNVDLDLACLYELKNGQKGVVQALGNRFGSLTREPFIALDGDDRTGSVTTGENIRINGNKLAEFERILVFTFIYEGAANWSEADGIVSIKQQGGPDIEVRLNEHENQQRMCAIALIRNNNNETFSIERLVQYVSGHQDLDKAFGWGMRWVTGSK